jgi:hypothetical protein
MRNAPNAPVAHFLGGPEKECANWRINGRLRSLTCAFPCCRWRARRESQHLVPRPIPPDFAFASDRRAVAPYDALKWGNALVGEVVCRQGVVVSSVAR